MGILIRDALSDDDRIAQLEEEMFAFYNSTSDYSAFQSDAGQRDDDCYFRVLRPYIDRQLRSRNTIQVLEIGAGRPTFPAYFAGIRDRIEYHVQDVTSANSTLLQDVADHCHIAKLSSINGQFDLIFSTFVLEHVATPREFLQSVSNLLGPEGIHAVFCPRYDMLGYLCPSLRHFSLLRRLSLTGFLGLSRLANLVDHKPRFWVNLKPAVLEKKWYRDADAVHLVSRADLVQWHIQNGFHVTTPALSTDGGGIRKWILRRLLTVSLVAEKNV